jgi:DNA-binding response OmpR family regulator
MCRVLIIDDDPFFAETINAIPEDAGEAQSKISTNFDDAQKQVKRAIQRGKPFEVFLIDQRLGPGKDGIEVMQELRAISPDTDAIIFTGFEDLENGMRAYEAGAFRYLSKPFENRELLFLLKSLKQWRKEQREHGWQKIFSALIEKSIIKSDFNDISNTIVNQSLLLGFERVHLFRLSTNDNVPLSLIGVTSAGMDCIPNFSGKSFEIEDIFIDGHLPDPNVFIFTDAHLRVQEAKSILSKDTIALPLWIGTNLLGLLTLEFGGNSRILSEQERSLLYFYSRIVSVLLELSRTSVTFAQSVQES